MKEFAKYSIPVVIIIAIAGVLIVDTGKNTNDPLLEKVLPEIQKLAKEGRYRCCLSEPCLYCYAHYGNRSEGEVCDCLDEVVAGELPCGECLGEIIEGEGNKYLKEYFPGVVDRAIVEYREG